MSMEETKNRGQTSEDWDSDRTISDAEMLHEHIFGATRFRTATGDIVQKTNEYTDIDYISPLKSEVSQTDPTINSPEPNGVGLKTTHKPKSNNARQRKYVCAECHTTCGKRTDMNTHMKCAHGGYKCENCVPVRRFSIWYRLQSHMQKNKCGKERSFRCTQCELECETIVQLESHVKQSHGNHKCMACQEIFASTVDLNKHVSKAVCATHNCDECSKKFALRKRLDAHVKTTHAGFKCKLCVPPQRFKTFANLKQHIDKGSCMKFKCTECSLKFPYASYLAIHMKDVHGGFKCSYCKYVFPRKEHLTRHMKAKSCLKNTA
eukprot:462034_1